MRSQLRILSTKLDIWSPSCAECVVICHVTNAADADEDAASPMSSASAGGHRARARACGAASTSSGCSTAVKNSARTKENATSSMRSKIRAST